MPVALYPEGMPPLGEPKRHFVEDRKLISAVLACLLFFMGCREKGKNSPKGKTAPSLSAKPAWPKPRAPTKIQEKDEAKPTLIDSSNSKRHGPLNDVGPAAPMVAATDSVLLLSKDDQLHTARRKKDKFSPIELDAENFRMARGPALTETHAYWVSKGRLVRRALPRGKLEILAKDARSGTRVAALSLSRKATWVAFIGEAADDKLGARLWSDKGSILNLTPEGSEASSVALAPLTKDSALALSLEGRTGMSPVHARKVTLARGPTKTRRRRRDLGGWAGPTPDRTHAGRSCR